MTQPFLPGQPPIPYGMQNGPVSLPGISDRTRAPYGMTPGRRYVLPDQVNLDAPPAPEQVNLDAPASPAPGAAVPTGPVSGPRPAPSGWRVRNEKGEVVAELPNINTHDYQRAQVQSVSKSLLDQAITPDDKESAARAGAYMESLVGIMPVAEITKRGIQQYDTDERNSISRAVQDSKNKRAAMMGHGAPGSAGPTKADKYQNQLDKELRNTVDGIIHEDRSATKYNAITGQENEIAQMDKLLSSPNAMGQRVAVQRALLELTGKASRESEQAALTGAAGKWEELKNKLALWTSDDPQLSQQYIAEFRQMLAAQRAYIAEQKAKIGEESAQRAYAESFGYPDDQRQLAYSIVKGAMTGGFAGPAAYQAPGSKAAPAAKPAPKGFDPSLTK